MLDFNDSPTSPSSHVLRVAEDAHENRDTRFDLDPSYQPIDPNPVTHRSLIGIPTAQEDAAIKQIVNQFLPSYFENTRGFEGCIWSKRIEALTILELNILIDQCLSAYRGSMSLDAVLWILGEIKDSALRSEPVAEFLPIANESSENSDSWYYRIRTLYMDDLISSLESISDFSGEGDLEDQMTTKIVLFAERFSAARDFGYYDRVPTHPANLYDSNEFAELDALKELVSILQQARDTEMPHDRYTRKFTGKAEYKLVKSMYSQLFSCNKQLVKFTTPRIDEMLERVAVEYENYSLLQSYFQISLDSPHQDIIEVTNKLLWQSFDVANRLFRSETNWEKIQVAVRPLVKQYEDIITTGYLSASAADAWFTARVNDLTDTMMRFHWLEAHVSSNDGEWDIGATGHLVNSLESESLEEHEDAFCLDGTPASGRVFVDTLLEHYKFRLSAINHILCNTDYTMRSRYVTGSFGDREYFDMQTKLMEIGLFSRLVAKAQIAIDFKTAAIDSLRLARTA